MKLLIQCKCFNIVTSKYFENFYIYFKRKKKEKRKINRSI